MASSSAMLNSESSGTVMAIKSGEFGILAMDSRLCLKLGISLKVTNNKFDKSMRPFAHLQQVWLGYSGRTKCFKDLENGIGGYIAVTARNTRLDDMEKAVKRIKECINVVLAPGWKWNEDEEAEFIVVGAVSPQEPYRTFRIYRINNGSYESEEVEQGVYCIGCGADNLDGYVRGFRTNAVTPDQARDWAMHGIKIANEGSFGSGGDIRVVKMTRDDTEVKVWEQYDPNDPRSPYK